MTNGWWANRPGRRGKEPRSSEGESEANPYDIRERTYQFAARVMQLVKSLPHSLVEIELGRQLVRAGMSVGANVEEADAGESKKDFIHKMGIARKEARETRYWLRLLETTASEQEEIRALIMESDELVRILSTIIRNAKKEGEGNEQ